MKSLFCTSYFVRSGIQVLRHREPSPSSRDPPPPPCFGWVLKIGVIQSSENARAVGTHTNTHAPQTRPAPAQQPRRAQHRCPDAFTHSPTRPPQGDRSPSSCAAPPAPVAANSVLSPYSHSPHSPRRCAAPRPGPASRGNCALSLAKAHPAIELVTSNRQRRTLPRGAARGKRKGLEHKLRSSKATVDLCKKLEIRRQAKPFFFFSFNDTWGREGLNVSKSCKISVLSNILVIRDDD